MGSNNIQLANLLNVSVDLPYFFIEEHQVHYMFDLPHLLKATRNMLIKQNSFIENQNISWIYLKAFMNMTNNTLYKSSAEINELTYASVVFFIHVLFLWKLLQ